MIRLKFAFGLRADGLFYVTATGGLALATGVKSCSWTMTYEDEGTFLRRLVLADLDEDDTACLLTAVLTGVAGVSGKTAKPVEVILTHAQMVALGLEEEEASFTGGNLPKVTIKIKYS